MDGEQALQELISGNRRFMSGLGGQTRRDAEQRRASAVEPEPFAAVFGCSDSRVPPEIVFDQGLGDLFVVRTAGHILDAASLASLEFAVRQFSVPLIMVLGHKRCGAMTAAIHDAEKRGSGESWLAPLRPALELGRARIGDRIDEAVKAHTALTAERLRSESRLLDEAVQRGTVKIACVFYDVDSGAADVS